MDPSENACVERLTPKTVPINLIALCTVIDISSHQLKVQLTGGVICLVDRFNINKTLTNYIKSQESKSKDGPRLIDLFKIGEQYVCKIIDKQTRKGYAEAQDIIATLDPSQLQEDNIPTTLFSIPNVPTQCSVLSIEDHGYRMDLGFNNLAGFLNFEDIDNDESKLQVGQLIRCSTKKVIDSDTRMLQLMKLSKLSKFNEEKCGQCALTPSCILPGSKGYLTVMKVQRDGLIVNFLDEFAGFVNMYHLKEDWQDPKAKYKIADKIKCSVLYYNPTTKLFALTLKLKKFKTTLKRLVNDYYVGQVMNARVDAIYGVKIIYILFKVGDIRAIAHPRDALNEEIGAMSKDDLHTAVDSAFPDGSIHKCRIKSINYSDLTLVLSLRQDFLDQTCVSLKELEPADFLEVTIKKHVKDGIIVSFGLNLRGIILNTHLQDFQSAKSHKRYPVGKTIKSRVLKVDTEKYPNKVYLTNKEELMDPDMTVIDMYDTSFRGVTVNAVVVKLKHDGLIVELFNNVKGFIPRRFCSSTSVRTIGGLFQVGQLVSCTVYRVEPERQSLLLGIIPLEKIIAMKKEKKIKRKQDKAEGLKPRRKEATKLTTLAGGSLKKASEDEDGNADDVEIEDEASEDDAMNAMDNKEVPMEISEERPKSRLQRSIEAKLREEKIRKAEQALLNKDLPPQSIADFERNILKTPDSANVWIKYSEFFLDNVETEKARLVCRRALNTINFRAEKERLRIWLQLLKIEAKFGGVEQVREVIEEAASRNDKLALYQKAAQTLVACSELSEAEGLHEKALKLGRLQPNVWIGYLVFLMDHKKDLAKARMLFEQAIKSAMPAADLIYLRSRFAHLEFKYGEVERGKTLFENLLSENPKRMDIWKVYEDAIKKFGTRQMDTEEVRQQSEQILQRIATLKK